MRNHLKLKPHTIRRLLTSDFEKNYIQQALFSKVINYSKTEMAEIRYSLKERLKRLVKQSGKSKQCGKIQQQ
jgi:hypothetical protein